MVGAKVRMFRIDRGMSQPALAGRVGVSLQQIQKYEKGANRIGANRLSQIAFVLGISVGAFFESSQEKIVVANLSTHVLAEPGAPRVIKAYPRTSSRVTSAIARLLESIPNQKATNQKSAQKSMAKASLARLGATTRGGRRSSRALT
jgi:transcriptional regulator with XRE-family HTH domain